MKHKVLYTMVMLLLSLFQSCDVGCKKIPLSANDKSWMSFGKKGDTIIFSGEQGVDTFVVVDNYLTWGQCNRFELGEGQKQTGAVEVQKIQNGKLHDYSSGYNLRFNAGYANDTIVKSSKSFLVLNLETKEKRSFDEFDDTIIYDPRLERKINVLAIHSNNISVDHASEYPKISDFYWNRELGLVCYQKESGELFYYTKKY